MNQNNLFNSPNKNTELSKPQISIDTINFEEMEEEKNKKALTSVAKSIFIPNFENININKNIFLYITLGVFFIISLICIFTAQKISNFFAILVLFYLTLIVTTKIQVMPNTRYMNITTWNLYNAVKMLIKAVFPNLINSIDYAKFLSVANIFYIVSLAIAIIPSYSFVSIFALIILIASYITSFCNKDFESIKESTKFLNNITAVIINITAIAGAIIYSSDSLNLTGYMIWLFIHSLNMTIENYEFKDIEKEV